MDEGERGVGKKEQGQNSHRDVDELDEVTQKTHDGKADRNSFGDLDKFYKCQCSMRELSTSTASESSVPFCEGFVHRVKNCQGSVSIPTKLCAQSFAYLLAILDELLGNLNKFLEFLRHGCGGCGEGKS